MGSILRVFCPNLFFVFLNSCYIFFRECSNWDFPAPYFGLACDRRNSFFFALNSKKEKVLDRGQNGF